MPDCKACPDPLVGFLLTFASKIPIVFVLNIPWLTRSWGFLAAIFDPNWGTVTSQLLASSRRTKLAKQQNPNLLRRRDVAQYIPGTVLPMLDDTTWIQRPFPLTRGATKRLAIVVIPSGILSAPCMCELVLSTVYYYCYWMLWPACIHAGIILQLQRGIFE